MHRTRGLTVRAIVGGTVNSNISNFLWNAPKQCGALVIVPLNGLQSQTNLDSLTRARVFLSQELSWFLRPSGSPHPRAEIEKRRNWTFF